MLLPITAENGGIDEPDTTFDTWKKKNRNTKFFITELILFIVEIVKEK